MLKHMVVVFGIAVLVLASGGQRCTAQSHPDPYEDFRQHLQELTDFSPDPCGPPYGWEKDWRSADVEVRLFGKAETIVEQELNSTSAAAGSSIDRASGALKKLEAMSGEVNAAWPKERRFHFEILDLAPALVLKMAVRTHESLVAFGVPQENFGNTNRLWKAVGHDDAHYEHDVPQSRLDLYPLHRGPSGNARFLAKFILSGCAGSLGVQYDGWEWDAKDIYLTQIIKQAGSFGLDDKVSGFPQVGKLRTEGSLITLPYCWFSGIDTWDNPSLCVVDTYDVSGDDVTFRSRAYNRPDLLPIAKVLEYAEQRDYPAVRGYCASPEVARRLVREVPPDIHADVNLELTRTGPDKERVRVGGYWFDVKKRGGRWVVVTFGTE